MLAQSAARFHEVMSPFPSGTVGLIDCSVGVAVSRAWQGLVSGIQRNGGFNMQMRKGPVLTRERGERGDGGLMKIQKLYADALLEHAEESVWLC